MCRDPGTVQYTSAETCRDVGTIERLKDGIFFRGKKVCGQRGVVKLIIS